MARKNERSDKSRVHHRCSFFNISLISDLLHSHPHPTLYLCTITITVHNTKHTFLGNDFNTPGMTDWAKNIKFGGVSEQLVLSKGVFVCTLEKMKTNPAIGSYNPRRFDHKELYYRSAKEMDKTDNTTMRNFWACVKTFEAFYEMDWVKEEDFDGQVFELACVAVTTFDAFDIANFAGEE